MRSAIGPLLYLSISVAVYALLRFVILTGDADPYHWMAMVIALGCLGAAFTITHRGREER